MPTVYTFVSDGTHIPAGEYLVTAWDNTYVEIAWRVKDDTKIVWSPPVRGEYRGTS